MKNTPAEEIYVTLLQTSLHWENVGANLAMLEEKIWQIDRQTDLIILPEMFTTGFTMNAKNLAEPMNLTTFKWLKQQAAQSKAVITGSYIVKENEQCFNRLIWMQPDGNFAYYDKRHLFRMANEHQHYTAGKNRLITTLNGWKFCPLICYDLRFPVWSRNVAENGQMQYDCLIYTANFPQARANAWNTLLRARAIENLSYCIGVNRTGTDGNAVGYAGESAVIDMQGNELFYQKNESIIHTIALKYSTLQEFRQRFPAYLDADDFQI
ncbi:MAG: amidohydrolase [Cytophagales bacterium]|nr:MAG: amidohydrolase [Cytophagales bacterium]